MEKRREARQSAAGPVRLTPRDPSLAKDMQAELQDVSASGFRAKHGCPLFYNGLEVEFAHAGATGRARVVWNRIQGTEVESGFWILPQ